MIRSRYRLLESEEGLGLIEVMIAGGILTLSLLAASAGAISMARGQNGVAMSGDFNQFRQTLQLILSGGAHCGHRLWTDADEDGVIDTGQTLRHVNGSALGQVTVPIPQTGPIGPPSFATEPVSTRLVIASFQELGGRIGPDVVQIQAGGRYGKLFVSDLRLTAVTEHSRTPLPAINPVAFEVVYEAVLTARVCRTQNCSTTDDMRSYGVREQFLDPPLPLFIRVIEDAVVPNDPPVLNGCSTNFQDLTSTSLGQRFSRVIARHSLDTAPPGCPTGWANLWNGYSFAGAYTAAQSRNHPQDLGASGSCLKKFDVQPHFECPAESTWNPAAPHHCWIETPEDRTMWLVNDNADRFLTGRGGPVIAPPLNQTVSRCSVCEASRQVLVEHTQDSQPPTCRTGYRELWHGWSYLGGAFGNGYDAPQDLASPGSCLERKLLIPFMRCERTPNGPQCQYRVGAAPPATNADNDYASWLRDPSSNDESGISTCVVCERF